MIAADEHKLEMREWRLQRGDDVSHLSHCFEIKMESFPFLH